MSIEVAKLCVKTIEVYCVQNVRWLRSDGVVFGWVCTVPTNTDDACTSWPIDVHTTLPPGKALSFEDKCASQWVSQSE
jgi:hypothetical protein